MQDQGYHRTEDIPTIAVCQYMKDNGGYWRPWMNN